MVKQSFFSQFLEDAHLIQCCQLKHILRLCELYNSMAVTIPTTPLHGYQVIFSPYSPRKIAFTGAQNYGIAGRLSIVGQ